MDRKKFLRISGFSAAALLCTRWNPVTAQQEPVLAAPEYVSLWHPETGRWIPLQRGGDSWSGSGAGLRLTGGQGGTKVHVTAPGQAMEKMKIGWRFAAAPGAKVLGDDWERSYGNLSWEPASLLRTMPWYFLVASEKETVAFGVKTAPAAFCSWLVSEGNMELVLDLRSGGQGVLLGDRELEAAEIVAAKAAPGETPFAFDGRFCALLCPRPRLPALPVYGINDWYYAYGNNSRDMILQLTSLMVDLCPPTGNLPFSVVDDGWALPTPKQSGGCCNGYDYTRANVKFGDMSLVAGAIRKTGMRPGLWTRPLLAGPADARTVLTPQHGEKAKTSADKNKDRSLDPTIPENLHRIAGTIALHRAWGYDLVKHDYSSYDLFGRWGPGMLGADMTDPGWHFQDRSRTNAEIVLTLYRTIRDAAGPLYLIGCNTFSHLSAGLFELNRTGDDTSGREWERTRRMGVNTLGFRLPQHNRFYAVDGDCVGLTKDVPWEKNRQWLQLLSESGAPLFISAQPEAMGPEQKTAVKKAFALAAGSQPLGEPLDWMESPVPAWWKLNGRNVRFDWS